ncbi:3177_t:CDS:2, partial [Scutellospora calospora]
FVRKSKTKQYARMSVSIVESVEIHVPCTMDRRDISRRRPMLQLDQPISSIRAKNKATDEAKKRQESKNMLQELLGDYSESDDENDEEGSQIENPSKEKSPSDSFNSSNNQSDIQKSTSDSHLPTNSLLNSENSVEMDQSEDSIEAALKNFLSEINALPITSIDKDSTTEKSNEKSVKNILPMEKDQIISQVTRPEGSWQRNWHQEEKRYYYYNDKTGETRSDLDIPTSVLGVSLISRTDGETYDIFDSISSKEDPNREVDIQILSNNT